MLGMVAYEQQKTKSQFREQNRLDMLTLNIDTVATFFPAKEETNDTTDSGEETTDKTSGQSEGSVDAGSAREEGHASHKPPSKTVFSPADLRDDIYDDMNGGETFA
jgi:hypothetical protein